MKMIFLALLIGISSISLADVINVPADTSSIQGGIDMANNGDTVLVDVGTYYENIVIHTTKKITLASLYLITNDKSYIDKTVIDGGHNESVVFISGAAGIATVIDSTVLLCGFTITNGQGHSNHATADPPYDSGGGIYCHFSNPILADLNIVHNKSVWGGGILCKGSSPTLINLKISDNHADRGGGIFFVNDFDWLTGSVYKSKPEFDSQNRCSIFLNYALRGSDIYWGSAPDTLLFDVVLDTFSVSSPTDFHAYPINNFSFNIINAKIGQTKSELYVNPKGDNNNSGLSENQPLETLSRALMKVLADSMNPNTIHLANGEYKDDLFEGGSIGLISYLKLKGESREGVILQSENFGREIFSLHYLKYISIENLTIIGNGETRGIDVIGTDIFLKNITFEGADISLNGGNNYLENIKISKNMSPQCIGVNASLKTTLKKIDITNNIGLDRGSLQIRTSHVDLINSTLSGNDHTGYGTGGVGIISGSINIINSIIRNNSVDEIFITTGPDYPNSSILVQNSLLEDGESAINIIGGENDIYWLDGNIDSDPMFINTSEDDYRLKEGSPCIDKGIQDTTIIYNNGQDTLYIPSIEYVGSAPEMGAYEFGDPLAVDYHAVKLPDRYFLMQNYPNPFNPTTTIVYQIRTPNHVDLSIYNLVGQKVTTLVSSTQNAGTHQVEWDASEFASGVYYYKLEVGDYQQVMKMILMK